MAIDLRKEQTEPENLITGPHGEIVVSGPRGSFKLLVDDAEVAGLPFIAFAGPVAEGIGQVTAELPKDFREIDAMFLVVKFAGITNVSVPPPSGWTLMQFSGEPAAQGVNAPAEYLSVFRRMAYNTDTAPTIMHAGPGDRRILAQIVACRPQERGE